MNPNSILSGGSTPVDATASNAFFEPQRSRIPLPNPNKKASEATVGQCSGSSDRKEFNVIPVEDRRLVRSSGGLGLQDYWLDCWEADPFGSRYVLMPDTNFKSSTHRKYRKQLKDLGLFLFQIRQDGNNYQLWVLNRHGARVKSYWQGTSSQTVERADEIGEAVPKHVVQVVKRGAELTECDCTTIKHGDKIGEAKSVTQSVREVQERSISFQNHIYDQQQFNSTVVDLKKFEEEEEGIQKIDGSGFTQETQEPTGILEEPKPDLIAQQEQAAAQLKDERQNLNDLRRLGVELNETVRAVMKKEEANVLGAIAHIQQRYDNRERFHNITGAFVKACLDGSRRKPFTLVEVNPPTPTQMSQLQRAKASRTIRDFYLAPLGNNEQAFVVDTGFETMPWWKFFECGVDGSP